MVFSSIFFIFFFLPFILSCYFLTKVKFRNFVLLFASLLFYSWGESNFVFVLVVAILINYLLGILTENQDNNFTKNLLLVVAILVNLGSLAYFKYTSFFINNLNLLFSKIHIQSISSFKIHLPLGISFFTFHALSYIIDIYRKKANAQKDIAKLALYFTFFPQLVAGPIVRYHDIEMQLIKRTINVDDLAEGIGRFIIGLGKKVLIANTLAEPVDQIFAIPATQLTTGVSWLGIICYTLQIYFDFSGYSDMAIGLARLFGFHLLENFNYPYIAQSIKEFWQRWHISLSNWFRDYLYIPLGGNRCSPLRTYLNLLIVFLLCGFWHGASWNFIIWGLIHGIFLVIERSGIMKWFTEFRWLALKHFYALGVIIISWVFFRADTLNNALSFLKAMSGFAQGTGLEYHVSMYLNLEIEVTIFAAIFCSTPILHKFVLSQYLNICKTNVTYIVFLIVEKILLSVIFFASVIKLAAGTYNPFIYFRF